ncbi:MAG: hypothetical protein GF398_20415 [Chitinivibrionales bacterium]|nr:hypothetical protein [Chitinivibrionales bacterium]
MLMLYPIFLEATRISCVIVGGGKVAARKAACLVEKGAQPTIISPQLHDELAQLRDKGSISWTQHGYAPELLHGFQIVIAATNDSGVNARIAQDARASGKLVNVVDNRDECTFIVPASGCKGDISFAVAGDGAAPVASARIRDEFDRVLSDGHLYLLDMLKRYRHEIKQLPPGAKHAFWEQVRKIEIDTLDTAATAQMIIADHLERARREPAA